jgi:hypothetical protein
MGVEFQVGKVLEYLFQGGLGDRVLVDTEIILQIIYHSEHLTYSFALARHSQAHVITVGLQ